MHIYFEKMSIHRPMFTCHLFCPRREPMHMLNIPTISASVSMNHTPLLAVSKYRIKQANELANLSMATIARQKAGSRMHKIRFLMLAPWHLTSRIFSLVKRETQHREWSLSFRLIGSVWPDPS